MLTRRFVLGGLIAAPAVVAFGQLMPLRGTKYDPMVTLQSWPVGQEAVGEWWRHTGPLSRIDDVMREMSAQFGHCFWSSQGGGGMPAIQSDKFAPPQEHLVSEFGVAHGENRQDKRPPSAEDQRRLTAERQSDWLQRGLIGFSSSGRWFFKKSPFYDGCHLTVEEIDKWEDEYDQKTDDLIALRDGVLAEEQTCPPPFEIRPVRRRVAAVPET